jgi:hypothetical protein
MYKCVGINHAFHDMADSVFNVVEKFDDDVELTVDINPEVE